MGDEQSILGYFFTNSDRPVFALRNMPPAIQSYVYMGVSRFPELRQRFLKLLKDKGALERVAAAIRKGSLVEDSLQPVSLFAAEKNKNVFFDYGHRSAGEGATIFLVSERNPIYATEIQQDFYFPLTTMELSTRYSREFSVDRVYFDPKLAASEFGAEARGAIAENFRIYQQSFDALMETLHGEREGGGLPEKVSVLDSLRYLIPIAAHTSVIIGGNARALIEHYGKLLTFEDSFVQNYAQECVKEASKLLPEYFSGIKPDEDVVRRVAKIKALAEKIAGKKFSRVKEDVQMFMDLPAEETALTQILYPYCSLTFQQLFDRVNSLNRQERKEVFSAATEDRKNRANPVRGFETRPIAFEIEAPWALWKDFKRNRMNLRFHQPLRGTAGFDTPGLIKASAIKNDYEAAMRRTSELIEKIYHRYGGSLAKTVAAQGSRKRFLLCMGARQLTVLTELRTGGEGDKGYRRIASKMIELAKEKNPDLFGHIKDNFKTNT